MHGMFVLRYGQVKKRPKRSVLLKKGHQLFLEIEIIFQGPVTVPCPVARNFCRRDWLH